MSYVYFDIETIPSQNPDILEKFRSSVTAPATYKKPESIEKWLEENRESAAMEMLAKTSFDGGLGHVCTIAWARNDGDPIAMHADTVDQERQVIEGFFEDLDVYHSETLVGHYITGFDMEFLRKRAIVLGVKLPPNVTFPRDPKPWDKNIHDTMVMWAGAKGRVSMNDLCDILGIEGKGDFDGSQVADAWIAGEHEKIREYCIDDVLRTREIHRRFLAAGW